MSVIHDSFCLYCLLKHIKCFRWEQRSLITIAYQRTSVLPFVHASTLGGGSRSFDVPWEECFAQVWPSWHAAASETEKDVFHMTWIQSALQLIMQSRHDYPLHQYQHLSPREDQQCDHDLVMRQCARLFDHLDYVHWCQHLNQPIKIQTHMHVHSFEEMH